MKKYPVLLFIAGLVILIALQSEVIMPIVHKVIQSDLFLKESKDEANQMPISNDMTDLAFNHCNTYIKSTLTNNQQINLPAKPLNVWSLGNYQYVVNSEYTTTNDNQTNTGKYACRITYKDGDNVAGATDMSNWTIDGLSGLNQK